MSHQLSTWMTRKRVRDADQGKSISRNEIGIEENQGVLEALVIPGSDTSYQKFVTPTEALWQATMQESPRSPILHRVQENIGLSLCV
jgi:hypothetical protein